MRTGSFGSTLKKPRRATSRLPFVLQKERTDVHTLPTFRFQKLITHKKYHKISKMATEADSKSVIESGSFPDTDGERDSKRRVNLEAHLTAACGYGKKKQELVDSFWSVVWTGLAEQGWRKVRRITNIFTFSSPNFHQSIIGLMLMLLHLS